MIYLTHWNDGECGNLLMVGSVADGQAAIARHVRAEKRSWARLKMKRPDLGCYMICGYEPGDAKPRATFRYDLDGKLVESKTNDPRT